MFWRWKLSREQAYELGVSKAYHDAERLKAIKVFYYMLFLTFFSYAVQRILYPTGVNWDELQSLAYYFPTLIVFLGGIFYTAVTYIYLVVLALFPVFGVKHIIITKIVIFIVLLIVIWITLFLVAISSANKND